MPRGTEPVARQAQDSSIAWKAEGRAEHSGLMLVDEFSDRWSSGAITTVASGLRVPDNGPLERAGSPAEETAELNVAAAAALATVPGAS